MEISSYRPRNAGHDHYGAFGNLFLLRWPRRVQVQCHCRHPLTRQPYEETADYVHNLNILAAEICRFEGEARIIRTQ